MAQPFEPISDDGRCVARWREGRGEQMRVPALSPLVDRVEVVIARVRVRPGEAAFVEPLNDRVELPERLSKAAGGRFGRNVSWVNTEAHQRTVAFLLVARRRFILSRIQWTIS